jgi:hypothetical protein
MNKYGICAVAINEDPTIRSLVHTAIQDTKAGENVDVYMVSSEQMFPFNGHIPRFATFMEIPKSSQREFLISSLMKRMSYLLLVQPRTDSQLTGCLMLDLAKYERAFLPVLPWLCFQQRFLPTFSYNAEKAFT